jgi:hypothetical protein
MGMEGWTFPMLLTIAIRVLETLFVLGVVGSAVVVVLTAIEDFKMLFMKDQKDTRTSKDKDATVAMDWNFSPHFGHSIRSKSARLI